jgi:hypothetical protein
MTVPEENREKTSSTDDVLKRPADPQERRREPRESTTLREALEDADIKPDDYEEAE